MIHTRNTWRLIIVPCQPRGKLVLCMFDCQIISNLQRLSCAAKECCMAHAYVEPCWSFVLCSPPHLVVSAYFTLLITMQNCVSPLCLIHHHAWPCWLVAPLVLRHSPSHPTVSTLCALFTPCLIVLTHCAFPTTMPHHFNPLCLVHHHARPHWLVVPPHSLSFITMLVLSWISLLCFLILCHSLSCLVVLAYCASLFSIIHH